ncbi:MAG: hypothetical protein GY708_13455 [Actinomycetia bacterium]|nr:hypothetical protein [Actinomycetes bacterium]
MAWCDECDRYVTPTSVTNDGTCPFCDSGTVLVDKPAPAADRLAQPRAPWHFKLIVALTALYLLWRLVQFVIWLF